MRIETPSRCRTARPGPGCIRPEGRMRIETRKGGSSDLTPVGCIRPSGRMRIETLSCQAVVDGLEQVASGQKAG